MSTDQAAPKRHPLVIAWDEWLASKEGQECRAANTLAHNTNVYLENRLHRAFDAGAAHFDEVVASAREVLKQIDGSSTGAVNTEATEALREALAAVKTDSGNATQRADNDARF